MCGNVGLFGNLDEVDKEIFRTLLTHDTTRGKHGTGIIQVFPDFTYSWIKSAGTPGYLRYRDIGFGKDDPTYTPFFDEDGKVSGEALALIGHNRHATVGKVSDETAHPFDFDNVVGVHNGTLRMATSDLKYEKLYDVDSEVLYANINESSVPEVYSKVNGAMACVMWDKRDHTLNIWRNSERPLFVLRSLVGDRLMWASEDWMMQDAILAVGEHDLWEDKAKVVNEDTLYKLVYVDGKVSWTSTKMEAKKYTANFTQTTGGVRKQTGTTYTSPPQILTQLRGAVVWGSDKADVSQGFYLFDTSTRRFVHFADKNQDECPSPLSRLPDGMVASWDTGLSEHKYMYPADGSVTTEDCKKHLVNFLVEQPNVNVVEKKENNANLSPVKVRLLDMESEDAKFIKKTLERYNTSFVKGTLEPKDWIKVYVGTSGKNKVKCLVFKYAGEEHQILDSLYPYITFRADNYWLTQGFKIASVSYTVKRDRIDPEDRTYPSVWQDPSQLISNLPAIFEGLEEDEITQVYEVGNDTYSFSEYEDLIRDAGGTCWSCAEVPSTLDFSKLKWYYSDKQTWNPCFLCPDCAGFASSLHLQRIA